MENKERNQNSVFSDLFEVIELNSPEGKYDVESQTWSHRDWTQFSPVKNNQEM